MKLQTKLIPAFLFVQMCIICTVSAVPYVNLDFETVDTGNPFVGNKIYPEWKLPRGLDDLYGPGNNFEVVSTTAHTGSNSLRFQYDGRNGICNTCGTSVVRHKIGLDGVDFFVAGDGSDLTLENTLVLDAKGNPVLNQWGFPKIAKHLPHAQPGRHVYNLSRGNSLWEIVSIGNDSARNDKLILKLVREGTGSFAGQKSVINGDDRIGIARQCGVDGFIATEKGIFNTDRRSDCNEVILWFNGIAPMPSPGPVQQSTFRRMYLKTDFVGPPSGQKIHYTSLKGDPAGTKTIIPVGEFNKTDIKIEPWVTGLGGTLGGLTPYRPGNGLPADLKFERGEWYYIEEEFTSETYTATVTEKTDLKGTGLGTYEVTNYLGQDDGTYRLWMAKSGEPVGAPLVELTNIPLPPLRGGSFEEHMSFWGNFQHQTHSRGVWFIDDVIISDSPIGPIANPVSTGKATTKPPTR